MNTPPPPLQQQEHVQKHNAFIYHTKDITLKILPFFIKTVIFFIMIASLVGVIAGIFTALSATIPEEVSVTNLNKQYASMVKAVKDTLGQHTSKTTAHFEKNVFVLTFTGDVAASALGGLREEITIILQTAQPTDEVIIKLESGGGFVHSYGLAASQLKRIKDAGIPLTIVVDKVAASGGYMMACMADTLIAAPFAILGSIGVVAEFPNFSGWMKEHGISYNQYTSGEYKRTVSPFTEPTAKATKKMKEELKQTHELFKKLVADQRPQLNMKEIATGEIWYGTDALENHLIDTIATSDEIIMSRIQEANVYGVNYLPASSISERLAESASIFSEKLFLKISANYMNNR